jgi:tripartite-type tricarboxylate transporter receptor subunit TctC
MVAASAPDGYTFLLAPTAILAITPGVRHVPYNPDDLAAVCRLSTTMLPVTITNALGARSWQEFVVLAKQNPGKYWFGSSGLGTITHLTGEVLTRAAGIQMQHSPTRPSSMPPATSSTAASRGCSTPPSCPTPRRARCGSC